MGNSLRNLRSRSGMATPWRRRVMCVLIAGNAVPAALRQISAAGAFVETSIRPRLGARVELRHPDAGTISGRVRMIAEDGIVVAFGCGDRSVAFALAAIAADMTNPAR